MIGVEAETLCNDIRQSSEKEIYDDLRKDEPMLKVGSGLTFRLLSKQRVNHRTISSNDPFPSPAALHNAREDSG